MAIETEQDRLDLLEAMGELFLFTHNGYPYPSSKSNRLYGIFEKDYIEVLGAEGNAPSVEVSSAEVLGVVHGAMVRRNPNGTYIDYKVVGVKPDGDGNTVLILEEQ